MRAAWRLAISSASQRRSRFALLVAIVACSAVLISAVGVAMGAIRLAVERRVALMVGTSDARIEPKGTGGTLDDSLLSVAKSWEDVAAVIPRLDGSVSLRFGRPTWEREAGDASQGQGITTPFVRSIRTYQATSQALGIDPALEVTIRPIELASGRLPQADDEVVIDEALALRLSAPSRRAIFGNLGFSMLARGSGESSKPEQGPATIDDPREAQRWNDLSAPAPGDTIELVRFGQPATRLRLVGIAKQPPLGGSPRAFFTVSGLAALTDQQGRLSQLDLVLRDQSAGASEAFVERITPSLPDTASIQSSEKITSGIDRSLRANQLGFAIGTLMSFIAAGFIITTGMSVGIVERRRELAILRCIGATRWHLASSQLLSGAIVGVTGAVIGVPLGALAALAMLIHFEDRLQAPPVISWDRVGLAFAGAIVAGLVGALLPAIQAARVAPLQALASRGAPARDRSIILLSVTGAALVLLHLAIFTLVQDGTVAFYLNFALALPAILLGYFLLGVPAVLAAAYLVGPLASRALSLPRALLWRTVRATPYRFGFTAGAMMAGLSLMVTIWTQGGAAVRDWVDRIQFPDAFAVGLAMPPEAQEALRQLPFVTDTSAVSLHPVEVDAFGVRNVTRVKSFFVAFEPTPFFRMTTLNWVQGDPETALRRLEAGGAVIVTNEFLVARGMGVGSTFTCWDDQGNQHDFDIVGVVTSPGLEVASNFFDVGEDFTEQRIHAVFGSRKDLVERFKTDTIGMIQMSLSDDISDDDAMDAVRVALAPFGVLNAGSGRQIKETISSFVRTTLLISSAVAIFAMVVACLGVANLIIAGVQARQFEFGVMRAVGAQGSLLLRLVLAEALLVAIAACVLGTLMGVQGAFAGIRLNAMLWGVELSLRPPIVPILAGWAFVLLMCLAAAGPAALSLLRRPPRELLAAMRG